MSLPAEARRKIRFGDYEVDMRTAEVRQNGHKFVLQGQPFQVLAVLLERPGELVTREELKKRLWSADTFVDFDHSLNKAVNRLRETLSDSAETPRYIETLPRRGYRFIAEIAPEDVPEIASPPPTSLPENTTATDRLIPDAEDSLASRGTWKLVIAIALVLLTGAAGWQFWLRTHGASSPSVENLEVTRLTHNGTVSRVAISADGRYVAYATNPDWRSSLRLRQVATGSDTELLPPDFSYFVGLTFSPDGNYIYYVQSDPKDVAFRYLYSIPSLGGPPKKLVTDVDSNISFSPDGRRIAYERWDPPHNSMELEMANADGSGERVLATIHDTSFLSEGGPGPSWSPDGRTIVFSKEMVKGANRSVLFAVSVDDGSYRQLYAGPEELGRAVWRPSGGYLLIQMFDSHSRRSQLWTISFPDGTRQRFTHDAAEYWQDLDSTKDGKTLVSVTAEWRTRIWAANSQNLDKVEPITPAGQPMVRVAVNSKGKPLARNYEGDIWSMNFDGTGLTKLSGAHDAHLIAACGDFVVFTVTGDNVDSLMRVNADGMHPLELARGNIFSPTCTSGSSFLYYATSDHPQTIWRIGMQGGAPDKVAQVLGDSIVGAMTLSPDGKFLAYPYGTYATGTPGDHYAIISASDGSTVKSFDMPRQRFDRGPCWSPDGKYLQFVVTRDGVSNLWQHPVEGGTARPFTRFTSDQIFDFSWAPDGSRLFLTRGTVDADAVLLSGLR